MYYFVISTFPDSVEKIKSAIIFWIIKFILLFLQKLLLISGIIPSSA